jgi:hypothetical protein
LQVGIATAIGRRMSKPTQPEPKELEIICAWCPSFDPKAPANANASHGICPSCAAKF